MARVLHESDKEVESVVERLNKIEPLEWNNIAIPLVDTIMVMKDEIINFTSKLAGHSLFMKNLETVEKADINFLQRQFKALEDDSRRAAQKV
jgi:hypothetical protein